MKNAYGVIMAGGQGERYWPLTHKDFPKYRIKLDGKTSLLQKTYQRLLRLYKKDHVYIVTTKDHARLIKKELPELRASQLLIEPERRNTAAAILFSTAAVAKRHGKDAIVSFFPADHLIQNEILFRATLANAIKLASTHQFLATIGIKPTFPAIGYGYIQSSKPIRGFAGAYHVGRFTEKPKYKIALGYFRKSNYFWNGGIFTWRTGVFLDSMKKFSPEIFDLFDIDQLKKSYSRLPKISIDYALLEKTDNMAVLTTKMDWCDMGSWDMFHEKGAVDKEKNLAYGNTKHKESTNTLIANYTDMPIVAMGVSDLIIVKTERGILICKRGRSEEAALLAR